MALYKLEGNGVVVDITHKGEAIDASYASVTAPQLTYVQVSIDDEVIDGVWVGPGSSHSWWTYAGGKLLPRGLSNGQRLVITSTVSCALRIDWS